MSKSISVRELRENVAFLLQEVLTGKQYIITRRGKPVARLIPEIREDPVEGSPYPLRGSVLALSEDFDAPMEELRGIFRS